MVRSLALCLAVCAPAALASCDRRVAGGSTDGRAVYEEACARCHGPGGVPDRGQVVRLGVKDLTQAEVQARMTDDDIRGQIVNGSKNQQMPSFRGVLTDAQLDAVIAHVRTLRR